MITITEAEWQALQQQLADLTTQLTAAQQRIAELERKKTPPPAFVKTNVPARPKAVRQRRAPEHNQARQRETPTEVVSHPITQCPGCQGRLSGLHVGRRRQVIEVPPPPPVQVTEHQVQCGWCSSCHRWQEAPLDLTGQVVGQGRFGVRLAALITQMRLVLRTPIRLIQSWLQQVHGLTVSLGAISDLLRRVAQQGQPQAAQIHTTIQASAAVNADETTWREQGHQGYIWALATPTGERSFTFRRSRAGAVINGLLGDDFRGVLTTDFYAGYNDTPGGQHQRCWVHLLRDLHALTDLHPVSVEVRAWKDALVDLYQRGKAARGDPQAARLAAQLQTDLVDLAHVFVGVPGHPCVTLAKRLLRHQGELFTFLTAPGVAPDNNAAERAVRPLVVARKISGGSRSAQGTATHMTLASLVYTWLAQGRNPIAEVQRLFTAPLPQL